MNILTKIIKQTFNMRIPNNHCRSFYNLLTCKPFLVTHASDLLPKFQAHAQTANALAVFFVCFVYVFLNYVHHLSCHKFRHRFPITNFKKSFFRLIFGRVTPLAGLSLISFKILAFLMMHQRFGK